MSPLVYEDQREEIFRSRSAPPENEAFELCFYTGNNPASPTQGHFSLRGYDSEWINAQPNVLQIHASSLNDFGPAQPSGNAVLRRIKAARDGTFSAGISIPFFKDENGQAIEHSGARRTVGVYYKSNDAAVILAVIDATTGLGLRHQIWTLNSGAATAGNIHLDGLSFHISPQDSEYSMSGRIIYPATAWIEFIPPDITNQTGTLQIHRRKPGASINEIFDATFDAHEKKLQQILSGSGPENTELELDLFTLEEEETPVHLQSEILRQQQILFMKMLRAVSSIKQGGGDRTGWAREGWIVAIAIHKKNLSPVIRVADEADPALFYVGQTAVNYQEYLIDFSVAGEIEE